MNTILRAFVLVAALSFLSACATVSTDNPIGISGGAQSDAQLIGGWKVLQLGKDKPGDPTYVFFLPLKDGSLQAMVAGWKPATDSMPADAGWLTFDVVLGRAGEHRMINARQLLDDGKPVTSQQPGYVPLLYRFEADGSVTLLDIPDNNAVKDAVESGRLSGTVATDQAHTVHLTADPAALDAFFAAAAPMLFTEPMYSLQPLR